MTQDEGVVEQTARLERFHDVLIGELESLRARHANEAGDLNLSMRSQQLCPACGGRTLLFVSEVLDRADGPTRAKMSVHQKKVFSVKGQGDFQAYICTGCGLVEWYVEDPRSIDVDGKKLRVVQGKAEPAGPERPSAAADAKATDLEGRLAGLAEGLDAIEAEIEALTEQLSGGAGLAPTALRDRHRCSGCGGAEVLHATRVLDRSETGIGKMALVRPSFLGLGVGHFEAWICLSCGVVEWSIPDLSRVKTDGNKIHLVEGGASERSGPYR